MHKRKFLSVLVIVAFLGATVFPVSADDGTDALLIIGPAILGVALVITLIAVIGTRSKEKPQAETPGSNAYATLPAQSAESTGLARLSRVTPARPRGQCQCSPGLYWLWDIVPTGHGGGRRGVLVSSVPCGGCEPWW